MDTAPLLRTYIKDDIHGIKTAILDLHINPDDILTLNGKTFRVKHWQKRIASGLGEFQGFHGNNYFVLEKPLLTSITANFITYLIILVQFKVSELSEINHPFSNTTVRLNHTDKNGK